MYTCIIHIHKCIHTFISTYIQFSLFFFPEESSVSHSKAFETRIVCHFTCSYLLQRIFFPFPPQFLATLPHVLFFEQDTNPSNTHIEIDDVKDQYKLIYEF